jgi:hypothetical protein
MSHRLSHSYLRAVIACAVVVLGLPGAASGQTSTGGSVYVPPPPPAKRAKIVNGIAVPPVGAPARVKRVIAAANLIIRKPYVYGGGHQPYPRRGRAMITAKLDRGYDCSGTVSFALFGGRFLKSPLDSGSFMSWGRKGKGRWITVYTNPGHAYVVIGGLRLDTSGGDRLAPEERRSGRGPRWRKYRRSPVGFTARHPKGY